MRILTISGSLRDGSYNTLLLRAAEQQVPAGVEIDRYDGLAQVPPFHGDRAAAGPVPDQVRSLQQRIASADAVLIATPEYNGSNPGALKNALDWASTPFPDNALRGKPVAVIGASTGGYGGMWAQAELKKVLGVTGARVVNADMALARAHEQFDGDGRLADGQADRLGTVLGELLQEFAAIAA
jgi:chromate reductase, NAD(P)H dehydrogenase (quinone)